MSLVAALMLLAQVGPFTPTRDASPASSIPPELQNRKPRREQPASTPAPVMPTRSTDCAKPADAAMAALCRGIAASEQQQWGEAEAAFIAGQASATGPMRARLGAMAGNAALAQGEADRALGLLDAAKRDLGAESDGTLAADIALDRARALVALKRLPEASAVLAEARELAPNDPEAWLLSATLSRRQNDLIQAQTQIERAAQLLPVDPEIGLEAGVIAVLSGRDEAARRSWQSVIAAAPQTVAAETAKTYLAQLPPAPAGAPTR